MPLAATLPAMQRMMLQRWEGGHAIGCQDAEFLSPLVADDPEQGSTGKSGQCCAEVEAESHGLLDPLDDAEPCRGVGLCGVYFCFGELCPKLCNDLVDVCTRCQGDGKCGLAARCGIGQ